MTHPPDEQGHIHVDGGQIWFAIYGNLDRTPLLTLHGGPGFPHNYLLPLAKLSHLLPVIFFDQLGCGNSDRPEDTSLWRLERFVAEVEAVRRALSLGAINLFGHSWGSMLAVDYFLSHRKTVQSLVLASPPLSIPRWSEDARANLEKFPRDIQDAIQEHEAQETTEEEAYREATRAYVRRHILRSETVPDSVNMSLEGSGRAVYRTMWGISEWNVNGTLHDYDRTPDLPGVGVPTLITCGRYDEASPESSASYQNLMPDAKLVVFEKSAHNPHLEEEELYLRSLEEFLSGI